MIFRNARLILAEGIRADAVLEIEGGKITEHTKEANPLVLDLEGNYLAPGFIDGHVHGALGRDTMEASQDALATICAYHATGGTTTLLLTTATAPFPEIMRVLTEVGTRQASLPQVAGAHMEGPFLSPLRAGAQRRDFICEPDPEKISEMLSHQATIKLVTLAPEVPGVLELIRRLRADAVCVSGGHSDAWEENCRSAFSHGMRRVTHTFNCMSTLRRRGLRREAGLLEFACSEPEIMCELIADGHHVNPTLMRMLYRAKGATGIALVTDATAGAGLAEDSHFELYGMDCVVGGGVGVLADGSALAGSTCRMSDCVRTMVRQVGVPLHEAVGMATLNPARSLGLKDRGRLEAGLRADLVVLSPELEVISTFVAGVQIYPKS